ncbi:MAG TPA: AAA family ATPase, partial [Pyrinomonadaceae bacterium]|nr:AAA family ATPase [Pyrinomonadaceae bacterium]
MFKLQRLEITGFKSFADHTEIVFTGNGITAVVGPNGCGKSNVSDAISWVLGEQRAKSLRGGEMKDVVFQGTKNRKPSGMSEVVLHLIRDEDAFDADDAELEDIDETLSSIDELAVDVDAIEAEQSGEELEAVADTAVKVNANGNGNGNGFHTDEEVQLERVQAAQVGSVQTVERTIKTKRHWRPRSFALDFAPGEAVSVTRRLYLSGESEYLLNGKTCRLRDIQDLFAGTGLSGAHYAIVEQGRIGQILSAKPGDRRNLIEEAAGISKFRTRQRAAESRLESAKTNLGRISDIVSEIEKQANSLRRQAAKTRRYVALQEEFRVLLRQLFAAEGRYLTKLLAELEGKLAAAVKLESDLAERVTAQEDAFRRATRAARESEEALADVRRRHAESALERDRDERDLRYRSEQVVSLRERTTALKGEIEAANERLRLAASEQERLEVEEQKESAEADATRLILIEAEKAYSAKVDDVKAIEGEMDGRRAELLTHTAAVERFDELAKQLEFNIERLEQRAAGLEREAKRADETHDEHIAEAKRSEAELKSEREKLEGLAKEKAEITATAATAREALDGADQGARAAESELEKNRNRLETLRELEEKRAVYTPQIQKIFAGRENIGVRPLGVLADFLNVDERAERAVESAFGQHLQAVVVKDLAEARKLSTWLSANKIGRVSVLAAGDPGRSPEGAERNGLPGTVADALGVSGELRKSLTAAFPREMSARLVEELTESSTAGADMCVSLAGDVLFGGCLLITGSHDPDKKNESLLAFKRELAGLG